MRTWADIRFTALAANLGRLQQALPAGARLLLPVKADAYGHGAATVARWAEELGVGWFGVAAPEEALELRAAGVGGRILLFGPLPRAGLDALRQASVTPTLCDVGEAERWAREAGGAPAHLEIDTGMARSGLDWRDRPRLSRLSAVRGLELEGAYTHFASAESDPEFTRLQHDRFAAALAHLEGCGLRVRLRHVANSAGLLLHRWTPADLCRPGIAAYAPAPEHGATGGAAAGWRQVLEWRARVVQVRDLEPGDTAGYGCTARVERRTRAALLAVGYGDGYSRAHAASGFVLLRGARCALLGRVSMDLTLVDAGAAPDVTPGDAALLLGDADDLSAHDLAARTDTIAYEVLTAISPRVPRRPLRPDSAERRDGTPGREAGTRA